jgi:hypothetical protein
MYNMTRRNELALAFLLLKPIYLIKQLDDMLYSYGPVRSSRRGQYITLYKSRERGKETIGNE